MERLFKRLIASIICFTFSLSNLQYSQAQDFSINQLPIPGTMVGVSMPFAPLALKGLIVNPQKPLEFQFIVDTGKGPQDTASIKEEANQLIKYFLAGLTIPEGDLWVNLSPYEKNRMVPEALGQTDLGRDLLAQDYILKQLTASLIYPEKDLGKEFWSRVYSKAQQQFGTTNIPVNTFNKVWILPDQAQVYENINAAYVTQSTLKVMLDEDYTALQKHLPIHNSTDSIGSQIVREIVIPEITKEVNTGKNFAPLRQIYQALILAKWYKETIQNGLLDAVYTNKNKVAGVNVNDPAIKEQIYNRYLQAYKKGAFNYIKEDPTPDGQVVPRKYFSGGTDLYIKSVGRTKNEAMLSRSLAAVAGVLLSVLVGCGKSNEKLNNPTQNQPSQVQTPSSILTADAKLIDLGSELIQKGRYKEAVAPLQKAIELNPTNAYAYSDLGIVLDAMEQNEEAVVAYQKAIELSPKNGRMYNNLGNELAKMGQYKEAIVAYQKAIELDSKYVSAYYDLGLVLDAMGQNNEAIAAYQKAIELNSRFIPAYYGLGIDLHRMGKNKEAIASFQKAIELNPKEAAAYFNIANALVEMGQKEEATAAFKKAKELNPKLILPDMDKAMSSPKQKKAAMYTRVGLSSLLKSVDTNMNPTSVEAEESLQVYEKHRGLSGAELTDKEFNANAAMISEFLQSAVSHHPYLVASGLGTFIGGSIAKFSKMSPEKAINYPAFLINPVSGWGSLLFVFLFSQLDTHLGITEFQAANTGALLLASSALSMVLLSFTNIKGDSAMSQPEQKNAAMMSNTFSYKDRLQNLIQVTYFKDKQKKDIKGDDYVQIDSIGRDIFPRLKFWESDAEYENAAGVTVVVTKSQMGIIRLVEVYPGDGVFVYRQKALRADAAMFGWFRKKGDKAADTSKGLSINQKLVIFCSGSGDLETVEYFISEGADVNTKQGDWGYNPLTEAASTGFTSAVELLLDKGANVNIRRNDGFTPLMAAAFGGHADVVELLLKRGADINAKYLGSNTTALSMARKEKNENIVQILLSHGAIDYAMSQPKQDTAMFSDAKKAFLGISKIMLTSNKKLLLSKHAKESITEAVLYHAPQVLLGVPMILSFMGLFAMLLEFTPIFLPTLNYNGDPIQGYLQFIKYLSTQAYNTFGTIIKDPNSYKISVVGTGLIAGFLAWQNYSVQGLTDLIRKGSTNDEEASKRLNALIAMREKQIIQDKATLAINPAENGGIDLNQINVLRHGKTVNVQFDPAQLTAIQQGGFSGFTFKIESMTKIVSPFQLLGIK